MGSQLIRVIDLFGFVLFVFFDALAQVCVAGGGAFSGNAVGEAENHAEEDADDDRSEGGEAKHGEHPVDVRAPLAGVEIINDSTDVGSGERQRINARKVHAVSTDLVEREVNRKGGEGVGHHLQAREDGEVGSEDQGKQKSERQLYAIDGKEGEHATDVDRGDGILSAEAPNVNALAGGFGKVFEDRVTVDGCPAW